MDETVLIERAARGDRDAFDRLVGPRWPRMVRTAARIVGDDADAQDVAQQACVRMWQTLSRFRAGEDLDGWIYRMVVNLALDALRRRKARPEGRSGGSAMELPLADPGHGPDELVLARELEAALQDVTRDLPPRQKAVFVMSRVDGLPAPQIAEILGITASTVRNTLFQLRAALTRRMRERYPELARRIAGADEGDGT